MRRAVKYVDQSGRMRVRAFAGSCVRLLELAAPQNMAAPRSICISRVLRAFSSAAAAAVVVCVCVCMASRRFAEIARVRSSQLRRRRRSGSFVHAALPRMHACCPLNIHTPHSIYATYVYTTRCKFYRTSRRVHVKCVRERIRASDLWTVICACVRSGVRDLNRDICTSQHAGQRTRTANHFLHTRSAL